MLERLASFSFRKRRIVLVAWIVALPLSFVLAGAFGGTFDESQGGDLPGAESFKALKLIEKAVPEAKDLAAGMTGEVLFAVPAEKGGVAAFKTEIEDFLKKAAAVRRSGPTSDKIVERYQSPFDANQPFVSPDGTVAVATIDFSDNISILNDPPKLIKIARPLRDAGVTTEFGGNPFNEFKIPPSEILGIVAAIIILLVAFGSLIAMGLPILTALLGVGIATALVQLSSAVITMPSFVTSITAMIGLGVGIDYVLFIITRYREELANGLSPHDATVRSLDTSGRAVLFAGITVLISMLGMFLMRLGFVNGIAIAGALPVAVIVLASLTLIPAMLGFVGTKITSQRKQLKIAAHAGRETMWHRWSRFVQRNALVCALAGLTILLFLAAPLLSMRLGFRDLGNNRTEMTTRRAYDMKAKGFGPGSNGPFLIVADTSKAGAAGALPALIDALSKTPGVAFVSPIDPAAAAIGAVPITLIPTTGPQDQATFDLVHRLRNEVVPKATAGTPLTALVGGWTPAGVDFSDVMGGRLPAFIGAVLLLSFLLLMAVFRSVLVPLKAVVMNLLSIGASYGVIVFIFQQGHFGSVLGLGKPGPIEPWMPMMLFAIVFGLSMDYEVFLLSKIREEYDRRGDNSEAVVEGLAGTARLITAAAAIMICVFLPFVMGEIQLKLMGIGLATAVFLDATVVRILLVPATMELLGNRNWWFPAWLDRLLPKLNVEGHHDAPTLVGANGLGAAAGS